MGNIDVSRHKEPGFRVMTNNPCEAFEVLSKVFQPELMEELRSQAEPATEEEQSKHELLPPFPAWYRA